MNTDRLRNIQIKIDEKMSSLPKDVSVVRPEDNTPADIQADWLIALLSRMYTEHGITKKRNQLVEDIEKKDLECGLRLKKVNRLLRRL